ncbi:unnamed protein product [Blepharisma stoltei]|uniref:Large ribosomal subunit protein bL12 C-terminal domain-containing protein n=1 Tax=Blepharisma stoltei TaxID=1481888 RepID=A0AAU9J291_9CILI|nr:unnamed protein product [Blepharisma stoltei]
MLKVITRAFFFSMPKVAPGPDYQAKMDEFSQKYNKIFTTEEQERLRKQKSTLSPEQIEKIDIVLNQILNLSVSEMRVLRYNIAKFKGSEYSWPIFERTNKPQLGYNLAQGPLGELGFAEKPAEFLEQIVFSAPTEKVETTQKVEEKKVEKDIFNLVLKGFDPATKVKLIKQVKDMLGLGLKESKEFVENVANGPVLLFKNVSKESHKEIAEKLVANGGIIEFQ